jgi:hypothetical protein
MCKGLKIVIVFMDNAQLILVNDSVASVREMQVIYKLNIHKIEINLSVL